MNLDIHEKKHDSITKCMIYSLFFYTILINMIWVLVFYFTAHLKLIEEDIPNFWLSFIYIYHLIMVGLLLTIFPLIYLFMKSFTEYKPCFEKLLFLCVIICLSLRITIFIGACLIYNNDDYDLDFQLPIFIYIIFGAIEIILYIFCLICACFLFCTTLAKDFLKHYQTETNEEDIINYKRLEIQRF